MSTERIEYFDSLRGLAALAVLIGHYFGGYGTPTPLITLLSKTPFGMCNDGFAAVSLFFVLSGLVLSLKYFKRGQASFSLSQEVVPYSLGRIARIYLPFLAVLFISAFLKYRVSHVMNTFPPQAGDLTYLWGTPDTVSSFLKQTFLFRSPFASPYRIIPQDWTLTTEINLSLCIPMLVAIAFQSSAALGLFTFLIIAFLGTHGFLFHFTLGIFIAQYFTTIQTWVREQSIVIKTLLLILAIVFYSYRTTRFAIPEMVRPSFKESWIWYVNGCGSAILIMLAMGIKRFQTLLHLPWLTFLGKISYSFYLLHYAVIFCFTPRWLLFLQHFGSLSFNVANICGLIGTIIASVLVSILSYYAIEVPSIQWGRSMAQRFRQRKS